MHQSALISFIIRALSGALLLLRTCLLLNSTFYCYWKLRLSAKQSKKICSLKILDILLYISSVLTPVRQPNPSTPRIHRFDWGVTCVDKTHCVWWTTSLSCRYTAVRLDAGALELVNQPFVQQQDPISSRWRLREQSWAWIQRLRAVLWTPDQAKGPKQ